MSDSMPWSDDPETRPEPPTLAFAIAQISKWHDDTPDYGGRGVAGYGGLASGARDAYTRVLTLLKTVPL